MRVRLRVRNKSQCDFTQRKNIRRFCHQNDTHFVLVKLYQWHLLVEVHPITQAEGSGPLPVAYLGENASSLTAWLRGWNIKVNPPAESPCKFTKLRLLDSRSRHSSGSLTLQTALKKARSRIRQPLNIHLSDLDYICSQRGQRCLAVQQKSARFHAIPYQ